MANFPIEAYLQAHQRKYAQDRADQQNSWGNVLGRSIGQGVNAGIQNRMEAKKDAAKTKKEIILSQLKERPFQVQVLQEDGSTVTESPTFEDIQNMADIVANDNGKIVQSNGAIQFTKDQKRIFVFPAKTAKATKRDLFVDRDKTTGKTMLKGQEIDVNDYTDDYNVKMNNYGEASGDGGSSQQYRSALSLLNHWNAQAKNKALSERLRQQAVDIASDIQSQITEYVSGDRNSFDLTAYELGDEEYKKFKIFPAKRKAFVPKQSDKVPSGNPEGKVLVVNPQGQEGYIPASQLDQALKQGYKRVN